MKKVFVHIFVVILIISLIFQPSIASAISSSKVTESALPVVRDTQVQLDPLGPETPDALILPKPYLPDWRMDMENRYETLLLDPELPEEVKAHLQAQPEPVEAREFIPLTEEQIALTQAQVQSYTCTDGMEVPKIECEALVALYASTNGAGWTNNTNWLTSTTVGNWYGVTAEDGHVTRLEIIWNLLTGPIPPELGDLTLLRHLVLSWNQLSGVLPIELGSLTILEVLDMGFNKLSGEFPAWLVNLAKLEVLDLSINSLSGSIPPWLGSLKNLRSLSLHNTPLTGVLPIELGGLTYLETLSLDFNQLTGSIPTEFGSLSNLTTLTLSGNQLSGSIPAELGSLSNLRVLDLNENQLSGSIPEELGHLSNLIRLSLSNNQLTGSIPLFFLALINLDSFEFYNTDLCEPTYLGFLAWKASVLNWQGTGIVCQTQSVVSVFLPLVNGAAPCSRAPILLEPANGANLDTLIPLFKYNNGNDTSGTYLNLEIALDAEFSLGLTSQLFFYSAGIRMYRFPNNFDSATILYWRANFVCGEKQSPYSEAWSFTTGSGGTILPAPNLIAPADDSLLTVPSPELVWSAVDGAVEYIYHWTPTGQGGYMFIETSSTNTTFFCGGLTPNTTYDWWVKARNDYAWGTESVKWQFTTPAETQSIP